MQDEEVKKVLQAQAREDGVDTNAFYTKLAQGYDQLTKGKGTQMALGISNLLEAHFPDKEGRSSLQVYQIGFGTGRLGELLNKSGFIDIVGVQPCKAFADIAEKKGLYKTVKMRYCGVGDLEPEWKKNFDIAAGSGVFLKNHVPPSGFEELIDALKKGGVAAFVVREDEWDGLGYKEKVESLEKEGKWKILKRIEKPITLYADVQKIYNCLLCEKL